MIFDHGIPDVVPAGRMADRDQPVLALPGGLELRPWRTDDADADALLAGGQDPAIRQWNLFSVGSRDEAGARIRRMHERWRAETGAVWAIARPGGPPLGLTGLNAVDLAGGTADIMYWVLPESRGGGIVVETARRVSRWALDDLGLHRLRLCHAVANPASCRVAEKAGYAFEGTMRSSLLHADGWHDEHLHALVAG
ncbi:RimJ/RimL family protein N-acetyltransferase [Streptomyces griseochromogenes]|uniref:Acetyltransferase n=1 Tax=Streptomyces griseochromogenes TaxID=68214 RepID=A0A1B1AX94_9ACTN|nr:GNAT family N-acetyltransferase [Streptomyces griseochromogenes]ANP51208.1 acetyltransferase [Streptomyces griseochromogenes]MBP2050115.1 RimJ/RimL family protein N-acetyltransferase [Streptomyces griseochromogenes]